MDLPTFEKSHQSRHKQYFLRNWYTETVRRQYTEILGSAALGHCLPARPAAEGESRCPGKEQHLPAANDDVGPGSADPTRFQSLWISEFSAS